MKTTKRILVTVLMLGMLIPTVKVSAAGKITESGCKAVCVARDYRWYATGYTTSKTKHYTTTQLINGATGGICAEKGRVWGKGKVTATTKTICTIIACNNYGARVFYGF